MTYRLELFNIYKCGDNEQLYNEMEAVEDQAREDGYQIKYLNGDAMNTYVEFDTEEEMIFFKLKYL